MWQSHGETPRPQGFRNVATDAIVKHCQQVGGVCYGISTNAPVVFRLSKSAWASQTLARA